jgi:hypothetical protein
MSELFPSSDTPDLAGVVSRLPTFGRPLPFEV